MNIDQLLRIGVVVFLSLAPHISFADELFSSWLSVNGGNNHTYLRVYEPELTWDQAYAAAQTKTFMDAPGHLASITSLAENTFITSSFSDPAHYGRFALGGLDDPPRWITGEPFTYSNWYTGEPNSSQEDTIQIYFAGDGSNGHWNDLSRGEGLGGYIVEFNVIPEPTSSLLLLTGVVLLASRHGRRRVHAMATR